MSDPDEVTSVHPADLRVADPTPDKVREQAIDIHGLWSELVRTDPGTTSGWHHHGEHDTSVYVVEGTVRIEFGPGGTQAVDAGPGDFLHIPRHVVHREINPGSNPSQEVVTRSGTGPLSINVDGPAPRPVTTPSAPRPLARKSEALVSLRRLSPRSPAG